MVKASVKRKAREVDEHPQATESSTALVAAQIEFKNARSGGFEQQGELDCPDPGPSSTPGSFALLLLIVSAERAWPRAWLDISTDEQQQSEARQRVEG